MNRLKREAACLLIRISWVLTWVAMKVYGLHEMFVPPEKPERLSDEELQRIQEENSSDPDSFTLELVAWNGNDGENQAKFVLSPQQYEDILSKVGRKPNLEDSSLIDLAAALGLREVA